MGTHGNAWGYDEIQWGQGDLHCPRAAKTATVAELCGLAAGTAWANC